MIKVATNRNICFSYIVILVYHFTAVFQHVTAVFILGDSESSLPHRDDISPVDPEIDGQNHSDSTFLAGMAGVKLKEMRKLARLAGLEHPEKITEFADGVCYKDDCLEAANEFYTSMDFTKNPCLEWRKFACEWRTLSSKTSLDQMSALALKAENQVVEILHDTNIQTGPVHSAQNYFQACIKWFQGFNQVVHVKNYLKTLGGWPLLEGSEFQGDWTEIFIIISKLSSAAIKPFLLKLVASPISDKRTVLELDTGSGDLKIQTKEILEILRHLRMHKSSVTTSEDGGKIQAMQKCMRALSLSKFNSSLDSTPSVMSLKNLQDKLSETVPNFKMNVTGLVQKVFSGTSLLISGNTDVLVNVEYMSQYFSTIHQVDKTALVNNLFLQLTLILLGDMTDTFDESKFSNMANYKHASNSPPYSSYRRCIIETTDLFSHALSEEYIKRHYKSGTEEKVQNIVQHLKTGFSATLQDIKWLTPSSKQLFDTRIKRIETQVGFPKWTSTEQSRWHQYYSGLETQLNLNGNGSEVGIYLTFRMAALSGFNIFRLVSTLKGERNQDGWMESEKFVGYTVVEYFPDLHQLRIPVGALQLPLYEDDFPGFMNFGGIGSVIAREMARIIDAKGIFLNENDTAGLFLDQVSLKGYMEWSQQLQSEWEKGNEHDLNLNDKIIHVLAYHITLNGYKDFLNTVKEEKGEAEIKLPGLDQIEPEKLLNIKYSNVLCEDPLIKRSRANARRHHSFSRYGISAVTQTTQFALLFGCDEDNSRVKKAFDFVL